MISLQTILAIIFIIGIGGLIWTVVRFPRDVFNGIFVETPRAFLERIFSYLTLLFIPVWLILLIINRKSADRVVDKVSFARKSTDLIYLNIQAFERSIMITGLTIEEVERELLEAAECTQELDISEYQIKQHNHYLKVILPNAGLYGFAFMVQWLTDKTTDDVIGVGRGKNLSFAFVNNEETLMLHGLTSDNRTFYINLFEDVDALGALRVDASESNVDKHELIQILHAQA